MAGVTQQPNLQTCETRCTHDSRARSWVRNGSVPGEGPALQVHLCKRSPGLLSLHSDHFPMGITLAFCWSQPLPTEPWTNPVPPGSAGVPEIQVAPQQSITLFYACGHLPRVYMWRAWQCGMYCGSPRWCRGRCLSEAFYGLAGFISWLEHFHRLPLAAPRTPACGFLVFLSLKATSPLGEGRERRGRSCSCAISTLEMKDPTALCADLLPERKGWGRSPLAPSLSGSCNTAATKFIPRKGNVGLMHVSTPELAEPSWHGDTGCEDVVEGQDEGSRMKAAGRYQLTACFPLQVQPVNTTRSSGGE